MRRRRLDSPSAVLHHHVVPNTRRLTPREGVAAECARRGRQALVTGCIALIEGRQVDDELVSALGGASAQYVLEGGEGGKSGHWPRVWAARGLLHAWAPEATAAIVLATSDGAWRVREMAAKVIARHQVDEGLEAVARLLDDQVPRVRTAAQRAVEALTVAGA